MNKLTISWILKVDIGISKGSTSDSVTADSNGEDWTSGRELFEELSFSDIGMKISNVEGCHRI